VKKLIAFLRALGRTRRQPNAAEPSWDEIEKVNRELRCLASNGQEVVGP
jgi:hypothetical protein